MSTPLFGIPHDYDIKRFLDDVWLATRSWPAETRPNLRYTSTGFGREYLGCVFDLNDPNETAMRVWNTPEDGFIVLGSSLLTDIIRELYAPERLVA